MIGQVPKFFGVPKTEGDFFQQTWGLITHLGDTQRLTLLVGVLSLAVVLACKKWFPLVPGSLLAVLLGTAASVHVRPAGPGCRDRRRDRFRLTGFRSAGRRRTARLSRPGRAGGRGADRRIRRGSRARRRPTRPRRGTRSRPNRELVGLGAANLGSGLCAGMVVNGSLSKTAVNGAAGARSQVSGLVVAVLTLITLLFLTGPFRAVAGSDPVGGGDRGRDRAGGLPGAAAALPGVDRSIGQHLRFRRPGRFRRSDRRDARRTDLRHPARPGDRHRGVDVAAAVPGLAPARGRPGQAGRGVAGRGTARRPRRRPDPAGGPGGIGPVLRQQRPCPGADRVPADAADPDRRAGRGDQPVHRHQRRRDAGPVGRSLRRDGIELRIARDIGQFRDVMRSAVPEAFHHEVFRTIDEALDAPPERPPDKSAE